MRHFPLHTCTQFQWYQSQTELCGHIGCLCFLVIAPLQYTKRAHAKKGISEYWGCLVRKPYQDTLLPPRETPCKFHSTWFLRFKYLCYGSLIFLAIESTIERHSRKAPPMACIKLSCMSPCWGKVHSSLFAIRLSRILYIICSRK